VVAGVAVGLVAGSGPAGRPRGARRRDRGGRHCLGGAERGLSVRLVEQSDFNAGTSSRSSKFVHGGLRYLKNGAGHLTCESVTAASGCSRWERGLVTPIRFLMTHHDGIPPGLRFTKAILTAYDVSGAPTYPRAEHVSGRPPPDSGLVQQPHPHQRPPRRTRRNHMDQQRTLRPRCAEVPVLQRRPTKPSGPALVHESPSRTGRPTPQMRQPWR
jgi:hypothetical protein